MIRTHKCNQIGIDSVGQEVSVTGWVHRRRDHGGVIFLDIRDENGMVQVVYNPEFKEAFSLAESCRNEYVIFSKGVVSERPVGTVNDNLVTGEVEIIASDLDILNPSLPIPFQLDEYSSVGEETRLKFRFLDLRRTEMQDNLRLRSKVSTSLRNYLDNEDFIEIETPLLTKATPEGARDYLVPSRTFPGQFFALPQSPQLFKQTLMASGFEKYFQFAKCFRDEDLRADRQPEFTQLDIEMSFADSKEVMSLITKMITGKFPALPDIYFTVVDVRDVANLHVQSLINHQTDQKRIIATSNKGIPFLEISQILRELGFNKSPNSLVPTQLINSLAMFNRDMKNTSSMIKRGYYEADISETISLFNWNPIPFKKTLEDMTISLKKFLK